MERRHILKVLAAAGVGSAAFGRALVVLAADAPKVSESMVSQAEWISGIKLTDEQRKMALEGLSDADAGYEKMRAVALANSVPPAFTFDPARGIASPRPNAPRPSAPKLRPRPLPASRAEIAFSPVTMLSEWVRTKAISSTELTKLYLERIDKLDPQLHAVVTRTDDLALKQAAAADAEIAKGRWKGPLHGIPYGAKDLL